jgi:DNA gyrase subunit B
VGVTAVNALSEWCRVQTMREGKVYNIAFERGRTTEPLSEAGETQRSGSRVWFKPDRSIFRDPEFQYDKLANRLRELAYLNSGLKISIRDERDGKEEVFRFERGIAEFVEHLNDGKDAIHAVVHVTREDREQRLMMEVAFQYTDGYSDIELSFANNINTIEGGTHLSASARL